MSGTRVVAIDRLELAFAPRPWPFAVERRDEIEAHFAERKRKTPSLWNGRVLILYDHAVDGSTFHGSFLEADYASFLTWCDRGRPEAGVWDCFADGALRGADDAFLLGVMSQNTANAGKIYFPSGTPDPSDIVGATVDFEGSVWRELHEETGLTSSDVIAERGWRSVFAGPYIGHVKILQAREEAATLRTRILANLARQREPELCDIRIARSPDDFDPMMPDYVVAFLRDAWGI